MQRVAEADSRCSPSCRKRLKYGYFAISRNSTSASLCGRSESDSSQHQPTMLFLPAGLKMVLGQSLLPDPAYEAYTSDAGIDGNSNFEVNAIWCAMGTPAPDVCLSHEIVSGDYAPASTFGFGTMDRVAGPDGDPESIYNQF